jgi:hypothetical protein
VICSVVACPPAWQDLSVEWHGFAEPYEVPQYFPEQFIVAVPASLVDPQPGQATDEIELAQRWQLAFVYAFVSASQPFSCRSLDVIVEGRESLRVGSLARRVEGEGNGGCALEQAAALRMCLDRSTCHRDDVAMHGRPATAIGQRPFNVQESDTDRAAAE